MKRQVPLSAWSLRIERVLACGAFIVRHERRVDCMQVRAAFELSHWLSAQAAKRNRQPIVEGCE